MIQYWFTSLTVHQLTAVLVMTGLLHLREKVGDLKVVLEEM
nr:hypothetical protein [uncultured Celeribacter sp.]